jgi:hypothetical protein
MHLASTRNLRIKPSELEALKHEKGLFAWDKASLKKKDRRGRPVPVFKPGETITEYEGEVLTPEEREKRYQHHTPPYGCGNHNESYVEDAACVRSVGGMANHKPFHASNAKFVYSRDKMRLVAKKNIYHDREIFVTYGSKDQNGRQYRLKESGVTHSTAYKRSTKKK